MHTAFAQLFARSQWLMQPAALRAMLAHAKTATAEAIQAATRAYAERQAPEPKMVGDVAVIEARGPVVYRASWLSMFFGAAAIEDLQAQFRAALADPAVRVIAFRWDSPGGTVEMLPEFADEIFAARGQKPIVSVADTLIASAAYYLASQTDTIYTPASGELGSIGTVLMHEEISGLLEQEGVTITLITHGENKAEGNPFEPLSDEARAEFKRLVDEVGNEFEVAVARGRGVPKKTVLDTFGQGRLFRGKQAISLGMADKLSTYQQAIGRLSKGRGGAPRAAVDPVEIQASVTAAKVCADCGRQSCPCMEPACSEDCPTCDSRCSCVNDYTAAAALAAAAPLPAAPTPAAPVEEDTDDAAILAALAE